MGNSWDKYINLGMVTHVLASPSNPDNEAGILEVVHLIAKDTFFNVIEIAEITDERIMQKVKEIIQISQMEVIFGSGYTTFRENLDLNSFDAKITKTAINRMEDLIRLAYFFNASTFAITSGSDVTESKREEAKKIFIDSMIELCEFSKKLATQNKREPLNIVIETFDREYTHKLLVGPTKEAVNIVEAIKNHGYKNIGVMTDLGHLKLLKEDIDTAISQCIKNLKHVHLGNCVIKNEKDPRFGDTHPYIGYPDGEIGIDEISQFLLVLEKYKYFGAEDYSTMDMLPTICFEIIRNNNEEDLKLLVTNAKRAFKKAWNKAFYNKLL